jgi:hypothetical protein
MRKQLSEWRIWLGHASGIPAQRQAIDGFFARRNGTLIARFTEVESGRNLKVRCTSPMSPRRR